MTREEAIRIIQLYYPSTSTGEHDDLCNALNIAIESLSADRPTGEWIIHDEVKNIYGGIYIECSECGTRFVTQTLEDEHFCRNCGAKMGGDTT